MVLEFTLRPMSHLRFYRSVRLCSCTLRLCRVNKPNQTNMTDYDILGSSLVLIRGLAKRMCAINRWVQKRLDMEQFRHFGSICEGRSWNGKSGAEAVFVKRQSRSVQLDSRSVCVRELVRQNRAIKSQVWHRSRTPNMLGHGTWGTRN